MLHGELQKLRGDLKQDHKKLADAEEHLRQSQESKVKAGEKASEAVTMLEENVQKIVQEKRTEGQRTRVPTAVYNVECPWDLTGFN